VRDVPNLPRVGNLTPKTVLGSAWQATEILSRSRYVKNAHALALLAVVVTSGCTTVPRSSVSEDSAAKMFRTSPNTAGLYVYRKFGLLGAAVGWDIALDGRTLGVLTGGTYVFREVEPGRHTLSRLQIVQSIQLAAGRNYFFSIAPSLALSETKFVEVSEREGRAAVSRLSRVITLY